MVRLTVKSAGETGRSFIFRLQLFSTVAASSGVNSAASAALEKIGLNTAASRLTTGNHQNPCTDLEKELAAFFGVETATIFPDGYLAPMAAAQAVAAEFTHVFIDSLAHTALIDAARMFSISRVKAFNHPRSFRPRARRLKTRFPRASHCF